MNHNPFQVNTIETERLLLIPFTTPICKDILDENYDSINQLGLVRGENWPDKETLETLPKIIFNLSKVIAPSGFESWMIVKKETNEIIGDVGFKGYNTIFHKADIGYGLIESERKKGYASEAVKALISWAFSIESLSLITAATAITNLDSIRLLQKLDFIETEREQDMIFWELKKN